MPWTSNRPVDVEKRRRESDDVRAYFQIIWRSSGGSERSREVGWAWLVVLEATHPRTLGWVLQRRFERDFFTTPDAYLQAGHFEVVAEACSKPARFEALVATMSTREA